MRVLNLIDSLALGGAEQSLVALAPHLIDAGVDLHVATLTPRDHLADALRSSGAEVTVGSGGGRRAAVRSAAAVIDRVRPDLIHTTLFEATLAGTIAGRRAGVPVVTSLVSTEFGPEHYRVPGLRPHRVASAHAAAAAAARSIHAFHAVSAHVRHTMSRRLLVHADRITVIPRGRDPLALGRRTDDRRARVRRALGLGAATPTMLSVARHDHAKGLDLAITAAQQIRARRPDAVLLIAGPEGPETADLRRRAQPHGDLVRFLGRRDDVADLMTAADVLCFPSRREGMPGTLVEALALELPVVATDLPSIVEVLGPTHPVVRPDDPTALAAAVQTALADDHPEPRHGRHRFLDHFTVDATAHSTAAWYRTHAGVPA